MRSTTSIAVAGAAAIGLVALAAVPANAAWTNVDQAMGARSYACKIVHGKTATIRYRIDARKADVWIAGGVSVSNASGNRMIRHIQVKAQAHRQSATKSVVVSKKESKAGRVYTSIGSAMSGSVDPISLSGMKKC